MPGEEIEDDIQVKAEGLDAIASNVNMPDVLITRQESVRVRCHPKAYSIEEVCSISHSRLPKDTEQGRCPSFWISSDLTQILGDIQCKQ